MNRNGLLVVVVVVLLAIGGAFVLIPKNGGAGGPSDPTKTGELAEPKTVAPRDASAEPTTPAAGALNPDAKGANGGGAADD